MIYSTAVILPRKRRVWAMASRREAVSWFAFSRCSMRFSGISGTGAPVCLTVVMQGDGRRGEGVVPHSKLRFSDGPEAKLDHIPENLSVRHTTSFSFSVTSNPIDTRQRQGTFNLRISPARDRD